MLNILLLSTFALFGDEISQCNPKYYCIEACKKTAEKCTRTCMNSGAGRECYMQCGDDNERCIRKC